MQLPLNIIEEIIYCEGFTGDQTSVGRLVFLMKNVRVRQDIMREASALPTGQRKIQQGI